MVALKKSISVDQRSGGGGGGVGAGVGLLLELASPPASPAPGKLKRLGGPVALRREHSTDRGAAGNLEHTVWVGLQLQSLWVIPTAAVS